MLRVALTGGVGSGKSAAAAMLRTLGARVSQSDEVARALMQPGEPVCRAIVQHFGPDALNAAGMLDRGFLACVAFEEVRVEELNALVHPAVIAAQTRWMEQVAADDPTAVAVVESALVFETKHTPGSGAAPWRARFDSIVVLTAPLELRRERYMRRLSGSVSVDSAETDFDRRAAVQWTDEQKVALADHVLRNEGSLDDLQAAVKQLYASLRQQSLDRAAESM